MSMTHRADSSYLGNGSSAPPKALVLVASPGPWWRRGSGQHVEKNRLGFQSGNLAQPIKSKQARFALVGKIDLQFQAGEADS